MNKLSVNTKSLLIMGIINATPDSFSGDGIFKNKKFSLERELENMLKQSVDIIDVGGESTRPASVYENVKEVTENEELDRVLPIIEFIKENFPLYISIDTKKPLVAKEAIKLGVSVVNDISMLEDESILESIGENNIFYVLNHFRKNKKHKNIIPEIIDDLSSKIDLILEKGIKREYIILDPGIGFGKKFDQSKDALSNVDIIKRSFNLPIMIGPSRKSFIGYYTDKEVDDRIFGTAASVAYGIINGANIIRVHDYSEMNDVRKMINILEESRFSS
ncbi:MAG: dihydropteroate synthase [Dehalococcoidia bacterium]|nr:dihydropteroate synthase [Dehalococcoidia bacterium]